MMPIIVISIIGLVLSTVIHFCSLFHFYNPPRQLSLMIQIGFLVVFYSWCVISKKGRGGISAKEFNKSSWEACPRWLATMTGFFILYALIGLALSILQKAAPDLPITQNGVAQESTQAFPSYWMALYALTLGLSYSCRSLTKKTKQGP